MVCENMHHHVEEKVQDADWCAAAAEEKIPIASVDFAAVDDSQQQSSPTICIGESDDGAIDTHTLECGHESPELPVESEANEWKHKYASLLRDYNEQHDEVEDLREEVEDANYFLGKEQLKRRDMKVANHELQKEVEGVLHDRDKLFEECLMMKALLTSRDQDIGSLVAQVNLLIQVGTIRRFDSPPAANESTTSISSQSPRGAGMMKGLSALFSQSSSSQVENKQVKRTRSVLSFGAPNSEDEMKTAVAPWRNSWSSLSQEEASSARNPKILCEIRSFAANSA
jgi:hypothetical protein